MSFSYAYISESGVRIPFLVSQHVAFERSFLVLDKPDVREHTVSLEVGCKLRWWNRFRVND